MLSFVFLNFGISNRHWITDVTRFTRTCRLEPSGPAPCHPLPHYEHTVDRISGQRIPSRIFEQHIQSRVVSYTDCIIVYF